MTTPSGGTHHYLRWRPGLRCSASQLGPGLDIRSDGGYVVGPPSARPDGHYEWQVHPRTPLPDWPDWLVPTRPKPVRVVRDGRAVESAPFERILAGLCRVVAEAPRGTRNDKLYWAAAKVAEHAAAGRVPLDVGAADLVTAATQAGLSEDEALKTIDSALRWVAA